LKDEKVVSVMYKFRSRFELDSYEAALEERLTRNFTEADHIEVDLGVQIMKVILGIHEIREAQKISLEELSERMKDVKEIAARFEDDADIEDMKLSALINYANALGGIVKIQIEFDDKTSAELL